MAAITPMATGVEQSWSALQRGVSPIKLVNRFDTSHMRTRVGGELADFSAIDLGVGRLVLIAMGYDFERGRLDLSAHPFTTSFHPTDVRVTTRVHEHELQSCLFSCIHEGGHGLYDQGLDQRYYGTPLGDSVSLGIHES